ncbi:MAG: MotA/TolQ/ExbB proton channel family protein [Burkholderiaceae bacterium]
MSLMKIVRAPFLAACIALLGAVAITPVDALAQEAASAPAATTEAVPAGGGVVPEVKKETIDNPYGLEAMWREGDFVTKSTAIILIIMSMGSWYIIFTKVWEQSKLMRSAKAATETFWTAGSVKKGAETLEEASAFRYMAEQGLKAADHHEGSLVEQIDRHTWIGMSVQRSVDNINSRLQDGLAFLATVGSTSPFVGLFGTVWGIYHALTQIGISGQASIDKVAGPVGEALIMTAFGLAVAVPAVMGYNWLIRRNKGAMERVRAFSGDLHNVLLAGKK